MLTQIKLKNFKIFKEETAFPLAKINLLTGINGRGKSSLLQSLLLMRQSLEIDENTEKLYLNGSCVRLGEFEDAKNEENVSNSILGIYFTFKNDDKIESLKYLFEKSIFDEAVLNLKAFQYSSNKSFIDTSEGKYNMLLLTKKNKEIISNYDIAITELNKEKTEYINVDIAFKGFFPYKLYLDDEPYFIEVEEEMNDIFDTFMKIHYVSANRIGPQDFYLKQNLNKFINVNPEGSATTSVLSRFKNKSVLSNLYLGQDAQTLLQQTEEWLKYILGNAKFTIDDTSKEVIYLLFNTQGTSPKFKPSNVGFGYSYILPIIVSGLIAQEGEILIVENPEAHLHPRAQSRLTEFLAKVASCGVQVFVESHSEHILHGLQIAAINQDIDISNEDISVLYFHEKENGYFTQIPIKPNGKIEKWVEGFFDQAEKDLDTILGF